MMKNDKVYTKKDWLDCDGCDEKLIPVFWEREWDEEKKEVILKETSTQPINFDQINDGLSFSIEGGYGEFFDSYMSGPITLNLCKSCCSKMFMLLKKTRNIFMLEGDN